MVQECLIKYFAVWRHALASSFLMFRVPAPGLHMMKNFSVMQRLHLFVTLEYGLARAIIFQVTVKSVLASFRDQMCLLNSVAFLLFSFLNEAVWFRKSCFKLVRGKSDVGFPSHGAFNCGLVDHVLD